MDEDIIDVPWWKSRRYLLAVLAFFAYALQNIQRSNFSIAIVCMVSHGTRLNETSVFVQNNDTSPSYRLNKTDTSVDSSCLSQTMNGPQKFQEGEFHWNKELQGILLGALFWGYLGLQVAGGWLSERFGAVKVFAFGMIPNSILTILSPEAARISPYLFMVTRVLIGLFSSVMFPSGLILWSRWAPPNQWSRLLGFSFSGGEIGTALSFPVGGFLCQHGFAGGWPSVFYVTGGLGVIWCVLWLILARDSPARTPGISENERKYIEHSLQGRITTKRKQKTPWFRMLTSQPALAVIVTHTLSNFFFYMMATQIPTYLKEVMHLDISSNGVFSMLPYIGLFVMINIVSVVSDRLISRKFLSIGQSRKLMNTLGMVLPAVFLIVLAQLDCDKQIPAIFILTMAITFFGFCFGGHVVNFADIAVVHAGTLSGISNMMATLPGIIAPYVVSLLTKHGTKEEWQIAFYIAAAVNFVGALIFLLFGSGVPQPWATPDYLCLQKTTYVSVELKPSHDEHISEKALTNGRCQSSDKVLNESETCSPAILQKPNEDSTDFLEEIDSLLRKERGV